MSAYQGRVQVIFRVAPATREKLNRAAARANIGSGLFLALLIDTMDEEDLVELAIGVKIKASKRW